jgi:SHS2 domain-containing protein
MENLEEVGNPDAVRNDTPSQESQETITPETVAEEAELTDEQLKEEIARLDKEIKAEEDAKEKRHKEQDKWWKMKIVKEREKAKALEEENRKISEVRTTLEKNLIDEAYQKTIDDNFGLPYFENLAKTNPDIANKLAKEKWGKSARELILDTKRERASKWDEELKKVVSEEDIRIAAREEAFHEVAIEMATTMFDALEESEKVKAKEYFDDIVEGKKLTTAKAKKYAEMAIFQATRNSEPKVTPKVDKERVIAEKASTGISMKQGGTETKNFDLEDARQQLLNAGLSLYQVNRIYPLK